MTETSVPSSRFWSKASCSRALRIDARIEQSGTVLHLGDIYGQATAIFTIIRRAITFLGGSMDDVIRTHVFTTDIRQLEQTGRAHFEAFAHMAMPPGGAFYWMLRGADGDKRMTP
jgi:Endoribonuclease L-PSP